MTYPGTAGETLKTELLGDLGRAHGVLRIHQYISLVIRFRRAYGQILLVGKDKEESITELILVQHALQFFPGLNDTVTVVAVDDEDDTLGVLEIVSPERTDLVLTTDIPHGKLNVLVLDSLDVETCRWPRTVSISRYLGAHRRH
jgi:hypothetical protein